MGQGHSLESLERVSQAELCRLVRTALVNAKGVLMAKTASEAVECLIEDLDTENNGIISRQAFYRGVVLLGLGTSVDSECLGVIFNRLSGGLEHMKACTIRKIAREPVSANVDMLAKSSKFVQENFSSSRAWTRKNCSWNEGLEEFRRNLKGTPKIQSMTAKEKQLDEWSQKSVRWEAKLKKAEARRQKQYTGMFSPWLDGKPGLYSLKAGKPLEQVPRPPAGKAGKGRGRPSSRFGGRGDKQIYSKGKRVQHLESVQQDDTLEELQTLTKFTTQDLELLKEKFLEEAEVQVIADAELPVDKFCSFFMREYPQLVGQQSLLLRLFTLFDTDGNGAVSFQEFILGLTKTMQCSVEEKLQMMFSCIDLSNDGNISLEELTNVIGRSQHDLEASIAYSRDFFSFLDKNGDGVVSLDEFKEALQNNPKLFKSLRRVLPVPTSALDAFTELQLSTEPGSLGQQFNLESLKELYKQYSKENKRTKGGNKPEMSRKKFRATMGRHFGLTRFDHQKLLDALFDSFDADGDGTVTFEEVLRGLSLLINEQCQEDQGEEAMEFYFEMLASNNGENGEQAITVGSELEDLLSASEQKLRSDFRETQELLHKISRDITKKPIAEEKSDTPEQEPRKKQRGAICAKVRPGRRKSISEEDFQELATSYPQLLQILKNNLR